MLVSLHGGAHPSQKVGRHRSVGTRACCAQGFRSPEEVQRFSDMMDEMCYIVATKHSGSLKVGTMPMLLLPAHLLLQGGKDTLCHLSCHVPEAKP
jgi:hypothetical protein